MNHRTLAPVFTALMAVIPQAFASSATDLRITGLITPSACLPNLSSGGVVDHGRLTVKDLDPQLPTRLETVNLQLEVTCEAETLFTLTTVDNRSGTSAIHPASHGLGRVNDDQMLGSVAFSVLDAVADNVPVRTLLSSNGGADWRPSTYLGHAGLTAFAAADNLNAPIAVKVLTARLSAFTTLVKGTDLNLVDEMPIDGHATLQVKYW
ncbi:MULTISPECIES: DUF1120 domain-containing protein [unclassified Pseudomonas]|uniref:DUF1120 domain-containing protein n=1 Tax=unclassified Pseudomonas TaxID=196821 RepID=UPI001194163A|nr:MULTISPECIES: DUF1120 domain-containing protein [unclassified Pseudomonas]MCJ7957091.1 DUF1120 domain-containing protein [Pseudomonas sp.]MCU1780697.1 DUF1120 domain-containing protein [Pseudomonas sp. 14P_5.3_Bac1]TVT90626.1 DUF1120 domain-containing protein [Pseudomonas sp. RGB]